MQRQFYHTELDFVVLVRTIVVGGAGSGDLVFNGSKSC